VRKKLKNSLKRFLILLFLFFCLNYPARVIFSKESFPENNQSLKLGISYLDLRKSFFDLPIVWKSSMPVLRASYQMTYGNFHQQISFDYGRSSSIDVNDSRKLGKNYFSILALNYDFVWYKSRHIENPRFFWGLGVSLENLEIVQKIEICPGSYSKNIDQYMGVGPAVSLLWTFQRSQYLLRLGSILSIPYASFGTKESNVAFTGKSYLWWFQIRTHFFYKHKVSKCCDLSIGFIRDVFVYGRCDRTPKKSEDFRSGGSIVFKAIEIGLNYNFWM
jgi:hypothetical protein